MLQNTRFLNVTRTECREEHKFYKKVIGINCRELKKCQKVPLHDLDLKASSE